MSCSVELSVRKGFIITSGQMLCSQWVAKDRAVMALISLYDDRNNLNLSWARGAFR